jgi:hypothetical protein
MMNYNLLVACIITKLLVEAEIRKSEARAEIDQDVRNQEHVDQYPCFEMNNRLSKIVMIDGIDYRLAKYTREYNWQI